MAHPAQLAFVSAVADLFRDRWMTEHVIEFGSYDVSGSIRPFFAGCASYVGVDLTAGPGVDVVSPAQDYPGATDSAGLVISCECFEHNPEWGRTLENMTRICKPGGLVVFTCASVGRLEHGTPRTNPGSSPGTNAMNWSYYRNLREKDVRRVIRLDAHFESYRFIYNPYSADLYFAGVKKAHGTDLAAVRRSLEQLPDRVRPTFRDGLKRMAPIARGINYSELALSWSLNTLLPDPIYNWFSVKFLRPVALFADRIDRSSRPRSPAQR